MSTFKLGPFCLTGDEPVQNFIDAKVRVVKVINNPGLANAIHNALGSSVVVIARTTIQGDDFERAYNKLGLTDPEGAALRWWKDMQFQIAEAPFAYWEAWNEFSNWTNIKQFGRFEAERIRIMHNEGKLACVGNFSTGCPPISDHEGDKRQDVWPDLYPMLEAADKYYSILGLHEYASLWLSLWYSDENQHDQVVARRSTTFPETHDLGWLAFRYRRVWNRHIVPNNWTNIRIALTEYGTDRAGVYTTDYLTNGANAGPWKQSGQWWKQLNGRPDSERYYFEQLQWAEHQMQQDHYLLGATIFCWGTDDDTWKEWDVLGNVGNMLLSEMKTHPIPNNIKTVNTTQHLYLRASPSGIVIGVLPYNDLVQVINDKNGWSEVKTVSGLHGYCMSKWLGNA